MQRPIPPSEPMRAPSYLGALTLLRIRARPLLVLALAAGAFAAGCTTRQPRPTTPDVIHLGGPTIQVRVNEGTNTRIRRIPLEEYVAGSVLAEVSLNRFDPAVAARVAQLQAIVTRTYAVANLDRHAREGFDLCATTHCQLFRPPQKWAPEVARLARAAANATRGLVIMYDHQPIQALFHSDCGGHTSAAGVVWGGPTPPYLGPVADPFSLRDRPPPWRFSIDVERLRDALNQDARTRVGGRLDRITIVERDVAMRTAHVVLDGQRAPMVRGEVLRAIVTGRFGARSIRSTRFTVWRDGSQFVFEGTGFGHGVGLCQRGAIARARAGHSPQAIIQHYYPGTYLDRLDR